MRRAIFLGGTSLFTAVVALASPAMAADTPAPAPEAANNADIIVTARKRDEKALDVPISLQAFTESQIRTSGITDVQTLKDRAGFQFPPQISNGPAGRFAGVLVFRGLQANSFGQQRDNSGSVFIDGAYVSGGVQSISTVGVERVEVLKGPQNTYFGRSTFGGAVNFITRNPSQDFGGEVNVSATARGSVDADASIEGAIVPGILTARLTLSTHNKVAQYKATDGGDLGAERSQAIIGTLYFTPTPNSFIRLRGSYQKDDDSAPSYAFLSGNTYATGACTGKTFPGFNGRTGTGPITLTREYFCNGLPSLGTTGTGVITSNTALPALIAAGLQNGTVTTAGVVGPARFADQAPKLDHAGLARNTMMLSGQAGYTFDSGASINLNVGYNEQSSLAFNDVDKTDVQGFASAVVFLTRDLTLDARFLSDPSKRIRVLAGASYYAGKTIVSQRDVAYATSTFSQGSLTDERANVPSVYGSVDFDILPNLTATGEARYQWDTVKSYSAAGVLTQQTFKSFLPRAILKFKPDANTNIYASYSEGVQPAGVNGGYSGLTALPFGAQAQAYVQSVFPGIGVFSLVPELKAYEIGIKQRAFDGAVDYSIAIYQNDWTNATTASQLFNPAACLTTVPQTFNTAACPLTQAGTSVITPNNARVRGIELAITGRVSSNLTLDLTADYKDAKWKRYSNTGFNVFAGLNSALGDVYRADGNGLGRVPNLTGTFAATYRGRINDDWGFYTRGDVIYTGKAWDSDMNIFKTDAYARVNVRFGIESKNATLELYSTNLFNNKTWDYSAITVELSGNFSQRAAAVLPAQKREFGLRGQFKF